MRKQLIAIGIIYAVCAGAYSSTWMNRMANYLGDASFGYYKSGNVTNFILLNVKLPEGTHRAITIVGWYSHSNSNTLFVTPHFFYTPDPVKYSNPDLLGGAWAHGNYEGTNLVTSFSFNNFPFSTYTNHPDITNIWKWGVYTVDGWSSNAVTLNLGGSDFELGPGTFNRNCIAGGSGDCILTGTGLVSIGISKTPCNKFYQCQPLINNINQSSWENGIWSTNGIAFTAIRVQADGTNHVWRIKCRTKTGNFSDEEIRTNNCSSLFSSHGIYQLSFPGVINSQNKTESIFDYRIYDYFLNADEIERVYQNGLHDLERRGL